MSTSNEKRPLKFRELTRISPKDYVRVEPDLGPLLDRKLRELRESGKLDLRPIPPYGNPFDTRNVNYE